MPLPATIAIHGGRQLWSVCSKLTDFLPMLGLVVEQLRVTDVLVYISYGGRLRKPVWSRDS